MSSRYSRSKSDMTPGPNAYEQSNFKKLKNQAPSYSMKFRHGKDKYNDTPGVGAYDIDRKRSRSGISMGFRHEAGKKDVFPGPGAYEE